MKFIRKNTLAFSLIAALILTLTWVSAAEDVSKDICKSITRLHIVASSDDDVDQALKLQIRDRVLKAAGKNPESLTDAEILDLCRKEMNSFGVEYEAKVERGNFYFPKKSYENITLPAGEYNAVRILLGKGAGQNWWCVMYPPLCFSAEGSGVLNQEALEELKRKMTDESFSVITESDKITIKPSFKLLEIWQEIKAKSGL